MVTLKITSYCAALLILTPAVSATTALTLEQQLGKRLFKDKNLSLKRNQACSSCHSLKPVGDFLVPGFVDAVNVRKGTPVSRGSIRTLSGILNAPCIAYAAHSPEFHWDNTEGLYIGGQFWNGRAANLVQQAKMPFLNPLEMAMPSQWAVVSRLKEKKRYKKLFKRIYQFDLSSVPSVSQGPADKKAEKNVKKAYRLLARAISAFESSIVFNKFNSKFDFAMAGMTSFSTEESKGLALFNGKANCAACHISEILVDAYGRKQPPLFTDFTYDNIGLPKNELIPNRPKPNPGLGGRADFRLNDPNGDEIGKHKVMTLRNIALTPPYGHNGVFLTLEQVVHFYNTRDTLGSIVDNVSPGFAVIGWPKPEIEGNVNRDELGNLGLTEAEEKAIVAFMKTLTDDYPEWGKDPKVPPGSLSPYDRKN